MFVFVASDFILCQFPFPFFVVVPIMWSKLEHKEIEIIIIIIIDSNNLIRS